jgi:hypothetical protein
MCPPPPPPLCVWLAQGDTQASANLAHMHVHGLGVPVDYDKALELLAPGMANREAAAYNVKAYMCVVGVGVGAGSLLGARTYTHTPASCTSAVEPLPCASAAPSLIPDTHMTVHAHSTLCCDADSSHT